MSDVEWLSERANEKESLKEKYCASDEKVKSAEMKWIKEQSTEFYKADIHAFMRTWNIATERNGDHVEK